MLVGEGMPVQLDHCVFVGNTATEDGGAVKSMGGVPLVTNCLFLDNEAVHGGAIDASYGELELEFCTFAGNSATDGGAVFIEGAYAGNIENCTFAFNKAVQGGAISVVTSSWSPLTITRTVIAFSLLGGGLSWDGEGAVGLAHVDIFDNAGGDWGGHIADQLGFNGNVSLDPLFCDAVGGNFALRNDSFCLPENNPDGVQIGAHGSGCSSPTRVPEGLPDGIGKILLGNHPNPFNPSTAIHFELSSPQAVDVSVYDLGGKHVTTLLAEQIPAGYHEVVWNGVDTKGLRVASGIYLYRLKAGGFIATRQMTMIK